MGPHPAPPPGRGFARPRPPRARPPAAEDLDRELLAALALATAATHREAALAQRRLPQVQLVLLEEGRVLAAKGARQRPYLGALRPRHAPPQRGPKPHRGDTVGSWGSQLWNPRTQTPRNQLPILAPPTCIMALLATAARPGRSPAPDASSTSVIITALLWSNRMEGATKEYPCGGGGGLWA